MVITRTVETVSYTHLLIAEINKNRRILEFRFVEGTIKLYADDIIYIETELHKNVFYTEKGTFQIYKKLDELENEFKDMGFVWACLLYTSRCV